MYLYQCSREHSYFSAAINCCTTLHVVVVVLLNGIWSGTTRVGRYQNKQLLWIFMEQERIMEAEAPTVRVGATPTGLTAPLPPQPLQGFLQAGCSSCRPTNSVKALKAQWWRHRLN